MEQNLTQQLIEKFNLGSLPPEEAAAILDDATTVVMNGVVTRGIPLLDEEGTAKCDQLLESDAEIVEIFKLLAEKVPSFKDIVDEEISLLEKTLA
jgi:hypothetical protein